MMKKLKIIASFALSVAVSFLSVVAFAANSYFPPERISCATEGEALVCDGFNKDYLKVKSPANIGQKNTLFFSSGIVVADDIFFVYITTNGSGSLLLMNTSRNIVPDLAHSNGWVKVNGSLECSSYMTCPITKR